MVNNAGIAAPTPITCSDEEFEAGWERTRRGEPDRAYQDGPRRASPPRGWGAGRVVNIASTEGIVATAGLPAYTATKHGVIGLTKSLAVELGRTRGDGELRVPGSDPDRHDGGDPGGPAARVRPPKVALRRYGLPEEVAHVTLSLALPASSYVNGAVVVVDGGMWIRHT